ncbi:MAG: hypothetical protein K2N52_02000 [Clostridia bacterium]|nr:hypothetical protein [Clostridia bacterium]
MLPFFAYGALADKQNLNNLTTGDKLTFRSNIKIEVIEKNENINIFPIVTLSSEGKDIVTFESWKSFDDKQSLKIQITCIGFSILSLTGSVISILYLVGVLPVKRKNLLQKHN